MNMWRKNTLTQNSDCKSAHPGEAANTKFMGHMFYI